MDHIKLPVNSFQPVLEVPYLAQDDPLWAYDNSGFIDYPERKGFDKWRFVRGQYESSDLKFALAMLQSWCYFGLVIEFFRVFDIHISTEDFLSRDASGISSVTSSRLPGLLRELESKERKNEDEEKGAQQFQALDSILSSASAFVSEIDVERLHSQYTEHALAQTSVDQVLPSVLDVVHLSVILLGQHLDSGAMLLNSYQNSWGHSPYMQQRLLQAGWCRSESYTFFEQLSGNPACLYYIAGIGRHTDSRAYEHRYCGDSPRCNRENLDRERYRTQHAWSCDNPNSCPNLSFEEPGCPNIYSIVSRDLIPVVTAIPGANGQEPFCSITSTASLRNQLNDPSTNQTTPFPYVCISHVWSEYDFALLP